MVMVMVFSDNGAYYYYTVDSDTKNYEETMLKIKRNAVQKKLPYK